MSETEPKPANGKTTSDLRPPTSNSSDKPEPDPSLLDTDPAADVLRRALGCGNQQAIDLAKTFSDEERAELKKLATTPDFGPGVRKILDAAADRQAPKKGPEARGENREQADN